MDTQEVGGAGTPACQPEGGAGTPACARRTAAGKSACATGTPACATGSGADKSVCPTAITSDEVTKRRRRLPHWQLGGSYYFLTFRSAVGELPPAARRVVLDALRHDEGKRYELVAAVVMPDHVHCIMHPLPRQPDVWYDLSEIMRLIKGVSAHKINKLLGTRGRVWQDETWDRIIRNQKEYQTQLSYLVHNPVKQEVARKPEEYEFTLWPGWQEAGWAGRSACPTTSSAGRSAGEADTLVCPRVC